MVFWAQALLIVPLAGEAMSEKQLTVFDFDNPNNYLSHVLKLKQRENSNFSLRAWSLKMGFASPSTLSEIISSKREILPSHLPKILRALKLNIYEKQYFTNLIYLKNAETTEEKKFFEEELQYIKSILTHEHSFIEEHYLPATHIKEAITISEKFIKHLQVLEDKPKTHEDYQLNIHFALRR